MVDNAACKPKTPLPGRFLNAWINRPGTLFHPSGGWRRLCRTALLDPFRYHAACCGLCREAEQLVFAMAARGRTGVRILDSCSLRLSDTGEEAWIRALAEMRRRYPGYLPPVLLGLDDTLLGYRLLTPPDPLPEDMPAWVVSRTPHVLPPGTRMAEITLDYREARGDDRPYIEMVWARRNRLQDMVDRVEQAGFRVMGVYPRDLAVAESVRSEAGTAAFLALCASGAITCIPLTGGLPRHLHEVAWTTDDTQTDWSGVTDRIRRLLPESKPAVTLVLNGSPGGQTSETALRSLLEQQGVAVTCISGPAAATALARAGLETAWEGFHLLSEPPGELKQQEQDHRLALRISSGGGLLIALLLATGLILDGYVGQRQRALTQKLTDMGASIADVRALIETRQTLATEVAAFQAFRSDRREVAALLESIGRAVPEGLWLRSLRLEHQNTGPYYARIAGFTRSETALAAFLANMDEAAVRCAVRSFTTSRMDSVQVRKQTDIEGPLIRFELTAEVWYTTKK